MKRIGILGGTFNPIHLGHLAMAQAALDYLNLDCVYFVPSSLPPHKDVKDLASGEDRYEMVKLAIKDNPKFQTSDFEIKKGGRSYSIDTVKFFRTKFSAQDKLYFIIGQDSYNTLSTWKNIDELIKLVEFVVINRPGNKILQSNYAVTTVTMPEVDISSSSIREDIQKKSLKNVLPQAVLQYIEKKKLYR
jgi:nicotinate-nucleotide adenylyltransferase